MARTPFKPGMIFVAPLLGGGYAFGYLTYENKSLMTLCDIFDVVGIERTPPPDLVSRPVLIRDLQVGSEFLLTPKHNAGARWDVLNQSMPGPVRPATRYFRMGRDARHGKRVDLFGEEPDRPLRPDESAAYPLISKAFAPVPVAEIEVAVKRLPVTARALIAAWRVDHPQDPPRPPRNGPTARATRRPYRG